MSVLLLVRSADDVPSAANAASEYLAYRRQHTAAPPEANEVLGIWLRRELEAGLLTRPCSDHESGADARAGSSTGKMASEPAPKETAVAIQESFSLSGLWTLCWIDGAPLREARSPDWRRRKILDAFSGQATGPRPPSEVGTFFPVFDAAETSDSIDSAMREIQDHYPGIVGKTWFVDHRERGIVSARGDHE